MRYSKIDGIVATIDQALSLVSSEHVRNLIRSLINLLIDQAVGNIKLEAKNGWLTLNGQRIDYTHNTGDDSSVRWPMDNYARGLLVDVLREMDIARVTLPDGACFDVAKEMERQHEQHRQKQEDELQALRKLKSAVAPTMACAECMRVIAVAAGCGLGAHPIKGWVCPQCAHTLRDGPKELNSRDTDSFDFRSVAMENTKLRDQVLDLQEERRRTSKTNEELRALVYPHGQAAMRQALGRLLFSWYFRYETKQPQQFYTTAYVEDQVERIVGKKPLDGGASDAACAVKARFDQIARELDL